ncbi:hypothetical protein [Priestia aryabhattai]
MNHSEYSMLGSASYNPKDLVLKMIKKIQLNSKNAKKYLEMSHFSAISERLINSIHLLEELDMSLNRNIENPTVERVSLHYQWLMQVYEEILESIDEDKFDEERFNEVIELADVVVTNLYDGFEGMIDETEDNIEDVRNEEDESNR